MRFSFYLYGNVIFALLEPIIIKVQHLKYLAFSALINGMDALLNKCLNDLLLGLSGSNGSGKDDQILGINSYYDVFSSGHVTLLDVELHAAYI
jgi:hypothetical protein